jgi:hypothetical protein
MTSNGRPSNGRRPLRTARLNLMIEPKLKRDIHGFAKRHHKSVSTIITEHFVTLLERERAPNIEQI